MTKKRHLTSHEERNYVTILRNRPNQKELNPKTKTAIELAVSAFSILEKLEDLGMADLSGWIPGATVYALIKQTLHIARMYFTKNKKIGWYGERNPEVIAGESTQEGSSAELVDSKRIPTADINFSPDHVAQLISLIDTLWAITITAEKTISRDNTELTKKLVSALDDALIFWAKGVPQQKVKDNVSFLRRGKHSASKPQIRKKSLSELYFERRQIAKRYGNARMTGETRPSRSQNLEPSNRKSQK